MSRGEVPSVLEEGPIAADDVDDEEDDFVRHVVEEQAFPGDCFLLQAEMYQIEDNDVQEIQAVGDAQHDAAECWLDNKRDR